VASFSFVDRSLTEKRGDKQRALSLPSEVTTRARPEAIMLSLPSSQERHTSNSDPQDLHSELKISKPQPVPLPLPPAFGDQINALALS
jgi:hypothetical protein